MGRGRSFDFYPRYFSTAVKLFFVTALLLLQGCAAMGINAYSQSQLNKKYADEHSKFVAVDDIVFHYKDEGQGPVVLLLHGVASSLNTWDGWTKRLTSQYRVIRVDLPGHGLTGADPSQESYTIEYMVDKLDKLLNQLRIDDVYLAGNSLGGHIAWNYALHRPDRVRRMVLLNSMGFPQDMPFIMKFTAAPLIGEISTVMAPRFFVGMNVKSTYGDESKVSDKLVKRYHDLLMMKGNREALVQVFRTMKKESQNPYVGARVHELKVPTLLMWGSEDHWVPTPILEQFEQQIEDSKTIVYEGVGHLPMEELPVQTVRDAHYFFRTGLVSKLPAAH